MSKYEITPLSSNKPILKIVKDIEKYLHDNQIYKIFGYNGNYDDGTELYSISSLYTDESLKTDDIVLFKNCYLGIVDAIGSDSFSVKSVISFKGDKGDTGAQGETGETGATGNGIASIEKTGTSGNVDTYTITYTNGDTDTFTITNAPQTITADVIDSEEATNGQVLTANGSGGAEWKSASSGGLTLLWSGSENVETGISTSLLSDNVANYKKLLISFGRASSTLGNAIVSIDDFSGVSLPYAYSGDLYIISLAITKIITNSSIISTTSPRSLSTTGTISGTANHDVKLLAVYGMN